MVALYALVHKLLREEDRLPNWEAFVRVDCITAASSCAERSVSDGTFRAGR